MQFQMVCRQLASPEQKRRGALIASLLKIDDAQTAECLGVLLVIAKNIYVFDLGLVILAGIEIPVRPLQVSGCFCIRRTAGATDNQKTSHGPNYKKMKFSHIRFRMFELEIS